MTDATEVRSTHSAALWFGTLAAPAAWALQILTGDQLFELVCAPGSRNTGVLGVHPETIMLVLSLACAVAAVCGAVVSYRAWRAVRYDDPSTGGRAPWMGMAGMFVSGLFGILIVQGFFPTWFLGVCERSL
ncbi:MAG: hypothetical protein H0U16_13035 [Actinobacteria bacterium]|nr:hypothetical protein [Actinomycetota bacterium]